MTDLPARPRIDPLPPADGRPRSLNIFHTLAHNKALEKGFLALGGHLLTAGVLPAREREIVILRTGWRSGSEYEFGQHTAMGTDAGLDRTEIVRLAREGSDGWSENDAALVAMVDELCADDVVTEETWQRLRSRWTEAELLELLVLCGYYRLVSGMLNSVGVALEPQTAGWPAEAGPVRRAPREQPS